MRRQIARPESLIIGVLVVAEFDTSVAADSRAVEFVCPDSGIGLSAVDVLRATGEHDAFLDYLREYDAEGYEILTDPAASDKTIWAPTDAAFCTETVDAHGSRTGWPRTMVDTLVT